MMRQRVVDERDYFFDAQTLLEVGDPSDPLYSDIQSPEHLESLRLPGASIQKINAIESD